MEHWDENDADIDEDFPTDLVFSPDIKEIDERLDDASSQDVKAVVWWVITFTCLFQTLHTASSRAIAWLLEFLHALLVFLGRYSDKIGKIANISTKCLP